MICGEKELVLYVNVVKDNKKYLLGEFKEKLGEFYVVIDKISREEVICYAKDVKFVKG